jgi:hypothetical protein
MDRDALIDDAARRIRAILESVFEGGVRSAAESNEEMKRTVLAALGLPTELAVGSNSGRRSTKGGGRRGSAAKKRAPKGAAREAVAKVFADHNGVSLKEIEDFVREINPLVSSKTIYNELLQRKDQYHQDEGKWFSVAGGEKTSAAQPATAPSPAAQPAVNPAAPTAATPVAAAATPQNAPAADVRPSGDASAAGPGAGALTPGTQSASAPAAAGGVGGT